MIVLDEVTVRFGELRALDGVSLAIRRGEVMGLLGAAGAGKSTLLALLAGRLRPHLGRVRIDGLDPVTDAVALRQRLGPVALGGPGGVEPVTPSAAGGPGLVLVDGPVAVAADAPEGTTVVIASRDRDALARACDRVAVLERGRIVARSRVPEPGRARRSHQPRPATRRSSGS